MVIQESFVIVKVEITVLTNWSRMQTSFFKFGLSDSLVNIIIGLGR